MLGVQSPKYPAEGIEANVRDAVDRLEITHPVVNDPELRVWEAYGVRAWPTLIVISPRGEVIAHHSGEATFEDLDDALAPIIGRYRTDGSLADGADARLNTRASLPGSTLSYPGKVLVVKEGVFVADTGHHRVLHLDHTGGLRNIWGGNGPGLVDGSADALFHRPQGMAWDAGSQLLYVADEENHAVRVVSPREGTVRTVAGTGQAARRAVRRGRALDTDLSSPLDLALHGSSLFVAMAGLHQVWCLDTETGVVDVWAGTGHEGDRDGPRAQAWLAQPMGIALEDGSLYIVSAETQSLARVRLDNGYLEQLAGGGLFAFGDLDGDSRSARMQHCQGVTVQGTSAYVADTYNNKIRRVDVQTGETRTVAGSGQRGNLDGPGSSAQFSSPGGVCLLNGTLYVADTNNHAIRAIDLGSGHVRTFAVTVPDNHPSAG